MPTSWTRVGAPRRPERALAFGKAALIDNTAALVRKARREASLGARYADMIRERAVTIFGVPSRLQGAAVDDYLDGLDGDVRFSKLAEAAADAHRRTDRLAAARALHQSPREKKRRPSKRFARSRTRSGARSPRRSSARKRRSN